MRNHAAGKFTLTKLDLEQTENSITLLVLESGAEWPTWGTGLRMKASNSAVEVQAVNELTHHFYARVTARLDRIIKSGQRVNAVGYACALHSAGRKSKRRALCSRLLASVDSSPSSEFILGGGAWDNSGEQGIERRGIIALWSELSSQAPGCLLSVRFEEQPGDRRINRPSALRPKGLAGGPREQIEESSPRAAVGY